MFEGVPRRKPGALKSVIQGRRRGSGLDGEGAQGRIECVQDAGVWKKKRGVMITHTRPRRIKVV